MPPKELVECVHRAQALRLPRLLVAAALARLQLPLRAQARDQHRLRAILEMTTTTFLRLTIQTSLVVRTRHLPVPSFNLGEEQLGLSLVLNTFLYLFLEDQFFIKVLLLHDLYYWRGSNWRLHHSTVFKVLALHEFQSFASV